jgi:hypothetical protein
MKPLDAKRYFKFQTAINCGIVLVIFLPLVAIFVKFTYGPVAILALMGFLYYYFFFVLQHRSISIDCPNPKCRGKIDSNTPWICGYFQEKNKNTVEFSFLNRCEGCGTEPKAYKCHHCGELIFFTEDKLKINFATCININATPQATAAATAAIDLKAQRQEEIAAAKHLFDMEEMERIRQAAKAKVATPTVKTIDQELKDIEAAFLRDRAKFMGAEDFGEKYLANFAQIHAGDPERVKRERQFLKSWLVNRIPD